MPNSEKTVREAKEQAPEGQQDKSAAETKPIKNKEKNPVPKAKRKKNITPGEATARYAGNIRGLRAREIPAYLLCLLMAFLTLIPETEVLPEFLRNEHIAGLSLFFLHLAVMLLGLDVILDGVKALFTLKPGRNTLIVLANAAALADSLQMSEFCVSPYGFPFSAAAALLVAFALSGKRMTQLALRYGFRTMQAAHVPTVIHAEEGMADEGRVLVKRVGNYQGFIPRMLENPLERLYRVLTPLILLVTLGLALILYRKNGGEALLHSISGILIAASSAFGSVCYSRPFKQTAKRLSVSGSAVAGWSGAREAADTVGMILRDKDLFPDNTLSVSGMKIISGGSIERVVAYTGSLILASGSGLNKVFDDLMRQYSASLCRVDDFEYAEEGGISAAIGTDRVLVGTEAYLINRNIGIPDDVRVEGAIYTAINAELTGIFYVNYRYLTPVGTSLREVLGSRLRPILALRNFSLTETELKSGFRLDSLPLKLLPIGDRYKLSVDISTEKTAAAIMTREGIGHYVNIAKHTRRLMRAIRRSLVMLVTGILAGTAILFFSFLACAYEAASAWNLLAFLFLWAIASMLFADNASGR